MKKVECIATFRFNCDKELLDIALNKDNQYPQIVVRDAYAKIFSQLANDIYKIDGCHIAEYIDKNTSVKDYKFECNDELVFEM